MPQLSECRPPWLALSSAACRMRWGPTPKAQPGSSPGREGLLVSSVGVFDFLNKHLSHLFTAAMGATFAATESIVANQREKQDALNGVAGGCAAGFLAGIRGAYRRAFRQSSQIARIVARSLPIAVASCAVIGAAVGTFDYAGQSLRGDKETLSFEEKRKRFFKQSPSSPPLSSPQ